MGISIYFSAKVEALAGVLSESISRERVGDIFTPSSIIVPGPDMRRWLELRIAACNGVSINLQFDYPEQGIWNLLAQAGCAPAQRLGASDLRSMIVSVLLDPHSASSPDLAPAIRYCGNAPGSADYIRRAWQLADKLAGYLLEYEFQRPDMIRAWLDGRTINTTDIAAQRCQSALYNAIFQPGGVRDRVNPSLKTLPQYAECLPDTKNIEKTVHVFSSSPTSPALLDMLFDLARHMDVAIYQPSAFDIETDGRSFTLCDSGNAPLDLWGGAERDMLAALSEKVVKRDDVSCYLIDPNTDGATGVLGAIQNGICDDRIEQDTTLQILACPGIRREVECVYNSIIANLESGDYRPTDIAVLAPDLGKYSTAIRSVFSRNSKKIPFSVAGSSAAQSSTFAQGVISLFDLGSSDFSRRDVFQLILNPCYLAAANATRETALQWLRWTSDLGIFRGFDAQSSAHTWQQGLRRLRLGRIMNLPTDSTQSFMDLMPYSSAETSDSGSVGRFSEGIERLNMMIEPLRQGKKRTSEEWISILADIFDEFLAIPRDRPLESSVRRMLFTSLDGLSVFDGICEGGVPVEIVREHVLSSLTGISAGHGRTLTTGITVAPLRAMQGIPFKVIYIIGLGEGEFPGTDDTSTLNLRRQDECAGVAENDRLLFLETMLSARSKLYLSYVSRDLEEDKQYNPCSVVSQLVSHLNENVLKSEFNMVDMPLAGRSETYIRRENHPHTDAMCNFDRQDRLLCLADMCERGGLKSSKIRELIEAESNVGAQASDETEPPMPARVVIRLQDLRDFLINPAEAALKHRLGLYDDDSEDDSEIEDEPFVTDTGIRNGLIRDSLQRYVERRLCDGESRDEAIGVFDDFYENLRLRSLTPDGIFAQVDSDLSRGKLSARIDGEKPIKGSLEEQIADCDACYRNATIGDLGAFAECDLRFPPVIFKDVDGVEIELCGTIPLILKSADGFHTIKFTCGKDSPRHALDGFLFYLIALCANELAGENFTVAISHATGITERKYQIDPTYARAHLLDLVRAYLKAEFDDLPFNTIWSDKMPKPWQDASPDDYRDLLTKKIDEDSDKEDKYRMQILSICASSVQVPADAYAKVRERFGLFARGFG